MVQEAGKARPPGQGTGLPLGGPPVWTVAHDERAPGPAETGAGGDQGSDVLLRGDPAAGQKQAGSDRA